jgi:hypothetical protein
MSEANRAIAWRTEGLRLTVFGNIMLNSWNTIMGSDPDQIEHQSSSPMPPSFEAGPYHGGRLVISQQPGRCDISLSPNPANISPNEMANLGELQTSLDNLLPILPKALQIETTAIRLAVGAVLLHPVASQADGVKLLSDILPISVKLPDTSEDVLVQINIPSTMTLPNVDRELKVNRLLKWNTGNFQILNMAEGPGIPAQVVSTALVSAVRFEMDINIPLQLSRVPLSHEQIVAGINALAAQASAVGKVGGFPR